MPLRDKKRIVFLANRMAQRSAQPQYAKILAAKQSAQRFSVSRGDDDGPAGSEVRIDKRVPLGSRYGGKRYCPEGPPFRLVVVKASARVLARQDPANTGF